MRTWLGNSATWSQGGLERASLSLGILMVNLLAPGVGVGLALPEATAATGLAKVHAAEQAALVTEALTV